MRAICSWDMGLEEEWDEAPEEMELVEVEMADHYRAIA